MSAEPTELWPWLALVGLGFFHGINPTMGWLFAVALGLHRRSFRTVLLSLVPIALGHATAIALVLVATLALGLVFDHVIAGRVAAISVTCGKRRPIPTLQFGIGRPLVMIAARSVLRSGPLEATAGDFRAGADWDVDPGIRVPSLL